MSSVAISIPARDADSGAKDLPRIDVVQDMRGFAALSVCCYHYLFGNGIYTPAFTGGWLSRAASHGWLGVQIFFVISGFVLPYSLYRTGYQPSLANYGRFLWKRLSRLEPPYLISIALMIGVMSTPHLLPWLSGSAPKFTAVQLLLHLGYLNSLFNQGWYLNPVFWTLGIEFQYYLLIGIMYPLLASPRLWWRWIGWVILAATAFADHSGSLGHWLFVFMLGFAVFQYRTKIIGNWEFVASLLLAAIGCLATVGKTITVVAVASCFVILYVRYTTRVMSQLGNLSYSFYLVHLPIGGLVFRWTLPLTDNAGARLGAAALSLCASLTVAYGLYRWVERPCQSYAGSLHFRRYE